MIAQLLDRVVRKNEGENLLTPAQRQALLGGSIMKLGQVVSVAGEPSDVHGVWNLRKTRIIPLSGDPYTLDLDRVEDPVHKAYSCENKLGGQIDPQFFASLNIEDNPGLFARAHRIESLAQTIMGVTVLTSVVSGARRVGRMFQSNK